MDPQADEFIGYITHAAKQMEALLKDLLAYTRAAAVNDSGSLEPVSAQAVMADVLESLKPAIEQSGAAIHAGELPVVRVDRVLFQLLQTW